MLKLKKFGVMVGVLMIVLFAAGCITEKAEKEFKRVTSIVANITYASILVNDEITIKAQVLPSDAENKDIIWNSSDENIATVSKSGVVKGIKTGIVTISAVTVDGNKTAYSLVEVKEGIQFNFITPWNENVYINYLETGKNWQKNIIMTKTSHVQNNGNLLWTYFLATDSAVEFYFSNGNGDIMSLGKVIMAGADGFGSEPPENFKTNCNEIWIKNGAFYTYDPDNSTKPADEILMLTINLHTYQESAATQDEKFDRVVSAIIDLDADIVALQECAQNKNSTVAGIKYEKTIRVDNMAKIITERLAEKGKTYNYFWDWEHYGWSVWEEGSAILSKYEITKVDSRYVSNSISVNNPNSRRPVMVELNIPNVGKTAVFSVHTGWWNAADEPFQTHFTNLNKWIEEVVQQDGLQNVLMGGDFNIEASKPGYEYVMNFDKYIDSYYVANPNGFMDATIGGNIAGWANGDPYGKRIDYIFMEKNSKFEVKLSQRIFTEKAYGRVSDHNGQYAVFKILK